MMNRFNRRQFLKGAGAVVGSVTATSLLAACQPAGAPAPAGGEAAASGPVVNALGKEFPTEALPLSEQFWREGVGQTGGGYGHIMESLYKPRHLNIAAARKR